MAFNLCHSPFLILHSAILKPLACELQDTNFQVLTAAWLKSTMDKQCSLLSNCLAMWVLHWQGQTLSAGCVYPSAVTAWSSTSALLTSCPIRLKGGCYLLPVLFSCIFIAAAFPPAGAAGSILPRAVTIPPSSCYQSSGLLLTSHEAVAQLELRPAALDADSTFLSIYSFDCCYQYMLQPLLLLVLPYCFCYFFAAHYSRPF